MTSRSSSIKPRFYDLLFSIRGIIALSAVGSLLLLLFIQNYSFLHDRAVNDTVPLLEQYRYFFFQIGYGRYRLLQVGLFGLGGLLGIFDFLFVNSKKMSNVYFSFNIKRSSLFINRVIAAFVCLFAAVLVPMLILLVINIYYIGFEPVILLPWFFSLAGMFTCTLIGFSVAALAAVCAGGMVEVLLYCLAFFFTPYLLLTGVELLFGAFLQGYAPMVNLAGSSLYPPSFFIAGGSGIRNRLSLLDPMLFLNNSNARSDENINGSLLVAFGNVKPGTQISVGMEHYAPLLLWLGVCVVLLFTAAKVLNSRRAENAGSFGKNRAARGYTVTLFSIFAFCFAAATLRANWVLAVAVAVSAFLAVYFIVEFVILRSAREVRQGLLKLPVAIVLLLCVLAVPLTGAFGYSKRVPNAQDVAEITVNNPILGTSLYTSWISYRDQIGPLTDEKDMAAIIKLHKAMAEEGGALSQKTTGAIGQDFYVQYKLKNGKTLSRYYVIEGAALEEAAVAVAGSAFGDSLLKELLLLPADEVRQRFEAAEKKMQNASMYTQEAYQALDWLSMMQRFSSDLLDQHFLITKSGQLQGGALSQYLNQEDFDRLRECLYRDYQRLGAREVLFPKGEALGFLMLGDSFVAKRENQDPKHPDYNGFMDLSNINSVAQITTDMSETVAYLKEKELLHLLDTTQNIKSASLIQVSSLNATRVNLRYDPGFSPVWPGFYSGTSAVNERSDYFQVFGAQTLTDSSEIARLYKNAYLSHFPQPEGYVLQFLLGDDSSAWLYVPPDRVNK